MWEWLHRVRDTVNGGLGFVSGGSERMVLQGRLAELGDRPYAVAARAKLDQLAADGYDDATERLPVITEMMSGLRSHLSGINSHAERFTEFKTAVEHLSGGTTRTMMAAFDGAPENVQHALMNAVTGNPRFVDFIGRNPTSPVSSMLTPDVLRNPQFQGPIADILNAIGNDPNYDLDKLTTLGNAAQAHFRAQRELQEATRPGQTTDEARRRELTQAAERAQQDMLRAVREAGGNVPAMANMNMNTLMQFLRDLFSGDVNTAMRNLTTTLGLQGQELANFERLVTPIAGFMQFMGQPYADYVRQYGPQFMQTGQDIAGVVRSVTDSPRTQPIGFDPPATPVRTTSLSGEGLTTTVASLDSTFNPNATGERTDGYRPTTIAATMDPALQHRHPDFSMAMG